MYVLAVICSVIIVAVGMKFYPPTPNVSKWSRIRDYFGMFIWSGSLAAILIWRSTHDSHPAWWVYIVASLIGTVTSIVMELLSDDPVSDSN